MKTMQQKIYRIEYYSRGLYERINLRKIPIFTGYNLELLKYADGRAYKDLVLLLPSGAILNLQYKKIWPASRFCLDFLLL